MSSTFYGRERELRILRNLFKLNKSALIVCRGRRRIGKSTLIQEFGKEAKHFIEIQGLPPRKSITKHDQLDVFSRQFSKQTGFPSLRIEDWEQAFSLLGKSIPKGRTVLLIDEISWLAHGDRDFAGKLKIAWDTDLKKHKNLVLVLCGSVSSWMERNILNNTGFAGRISLDLKLEELDLPSCSMFWGRNHDSVSSIEKLKLLCVTGGVPRYLEEVRPDLSAEENIYRMCFRREGFLFSEFDNIFSGLFSRRADTYKKILKSLTYGSRDIDDICKDIGVEKSGVISKYLDDLADAGFIAKDSSYNFLTMKGSKFAKYRLKDNYTRFYLRYIQEKKETINALHGIETKLDSFIDWNIIRGLQFENLILNNLSSIIDILEIDPSKIRFAAPYFQKKGKRQESCQVDLLILTKFSIYLCEIKFRNKIGKPLIREVIEKSRKLKISGHLSVRPVLIYQGELESGIRNEGYFFNIIDAGQLLKKIK